MYPYTQISRKTLRYFPNKKSNAMGSWFSDRIGISIDVNAGVSHFIQQVGQVFQNLGNALRAINWTQLGGNLGLASNFLGNILVQTNPIHLLVAGLTTNPLTGHFFMELNKFTGGMLISLDNVSTLPARTMRGDAISKQELIGDALFGMKIAAIVASGGSATAIIAQSSAQLGQGTLGQTALGRAILTVGSAAGLSALTGTSVTAAATTATENVGLQAAQTQVVKSTPLGQTALGQIAIGAGFAAGGSEIQGGDVTSAVTGSVRSGTISQASRVVPGGGMAAGYLIDNSGNLVSSGGDTSNVSQGGFDLSQIPGKIADAFSNISISSGAGGGLSIGGIDLSSIGFPSFGTPGAPSLSAPSVSAPEINVGQIPNIKVPGSTTKKKVLKRQLLRPGVYRYYLEDGTFIDADINEVAVQTTLPWWVWVAAAAIVLG